MDTRAEIENTLFRYARGYDTRDLALIGACLADEVVVEFRDVGHVSGRAAVLAELERRRSRYPASVTPWHVITNVEIALSAGADAEVASSWTFFVQADAGPPALEAIGRYEDLFVRERGSWCVRHRRIRRAGDP